MSILQRHAIETILRLLGAIESGVNSPMRLLNTVQGDKTVFYRHLRFCIKRGLVVLTAEIRGPNNIMRKSYALTEKGRIQLRLYET